jgi:hypothetical protein
MSAKLIVDLDETALNFIDARIKREGIGSLKYHPINLEGTPEDEANIVLKVKELKDKEEKRLNEIREILYKDAIEKEAMRRIQKEKADKIEAEKEAIRQKQLQEEMERLEQEAKKKAEQERLEREAKEKLEQERLEKERLAKEEAERERLEKERLAKEEAERERLHAKSVRKALKKMMQEKQARNIETLIAELEQARIEMEEQAKILDVLLPDYKEVLQRRLDARFKNSQKTLGDIEPIKRVQEVDSVYSKIEYKDYMYDVIQYRNELVSFFKHADLGKFEGKKLQEHPKMELFFKSNVGNIVFGVSLFNVWGNIQKIKNHSAKIILNENDRKTLHLALEELKKKRNTQILNPELTEEQRITAMDDLGFLEAGEIQGKDYVEILEFYNAVSDNTEAKEKLIGLTDAVSEMTKITEELNVVLTEPVKPVHSINRQCPFIPTVNARGTSPSERATKPRK